MSCFRLIALCCFAVSDHHHSTALYSHHHQAAMLQGAMSGPPGEARASSTSSYTAIGASSYPSAGPILSSQVSKRHRPTLTNFRTDLHKTWHEPDFQGDGALRDLRGSIFNSFSLYHEPRLFSWRKSTPSSTLAWHNKIFSGPIVFGTDKTK
jgi:hypothetical protein